MNHGGTGNSPAFLCAHGIVVYNGRTKSKDCQNNPKKVIDKQTGNS